MSNTPELSSTKRDLLEKYLRGERPPAKIAPDALPSLAPEEPETPGVRPRVVTIQQGGSKPPLFYLHIHAEGGAFYCFNLARDLGPEQPLYVLEPFKSAELRALPSFEAMAAAYVRALRAAQPEGPYQLVGYCGGGLIAFEMAQQLRAAGQMVDRLVMIEPRAGPDLFRMLRPKIIVSLIRALGALLEIAPEKRADIFLWLLHMYRLLTVRLLHPGSYKDLRSKGLLNLPFIPGRNLLRQNWVGLFVWMASHYRPRRYPGTLIYLWTLEEPSNRNVGKWGHVTKAKAVEIERIPGTQTTCRTTYLHEMAEHLKRHLR